MATIGSRGFVDDGTQALTVGGALSVGSGVSALYHGHNSTTVVGSGSVTFSGPGMYVISAGGTLGAGDFTGSVPSPATYPGSLLIVKDSLGTFPYLLSGTSVESRKALFTMSSGSRPGGLPGSYGGGTLAVSAKGSVVLVSDSVHWCVVGGSGSYTLAGDNL